MKALVVIVVDSGADGVEFMKEGQWFADIHGISSADVLVYNDDMLSSEQMRQAFYSDCTVRAGRNYDFFAYFGHGGNRGSQYPGGWIQLHFNQNPNSDGHVSNFAAALSGILASNAVLMFYGCLIAAGPDPRQKAWANNDPAWVNDGSFTQALSSELCAFGIVGNIVIGHTTAGHTTENAMVLVVSDCGNYARWHVVPYVSAEWPAWTEATHNYYDEMRFRFPIDYLTLAPPDYDEYGYLKPAQGLKYAVVGGWVVAAGFAVWYLLKSR